MKLRVIAKYKSGGKSPLTLTKEKITVKYGEEFEVDAERAAEILKATFQGNPVAEIVEEPKDEKTTGSKK